MRTQPRSARDESQHDSNSNITGVARHGRSGGPTDMRRSVSDSRKREATFRSWHEEQKSRGGDGWSQGNRAGCGGIIRIQSVSHRALSLQLAITLAITIWHRKTLSPSDHSSNFTHSAATLTLIKISLFLCEMNNYRINRS